MRNACRDVAAPCRVKKGEMMILEEHTGGITARLSDFNLNTILLSGQCFRLKQVGAQKYDLVANGRYLEMHVTAPGQFFFSCSLEEFQTIWRPYFDLDTDYRSFCAHIPPQDGYLQQAVCRCSGMKILRQQPWEMLITFILSQRKTIPAIAQCVESLSRRYGAPIQTPKGKIVYAFPCPEALAARGEEELMECALGYRAKYVLDASRRVASGSLDLEALHALDDETLEQTLCSIYGVGVKVARCVMLYGYHRLAAVPIDTWMARIIQREYNGRFPYNWYGAQSGVLQQYMFLYERIYYGKEP